MVYHHFTTSNELMSLDIKHQHVTEETDIVCLLGTEHTTTHDLAKKIHSDQTHSGQTSGPSNQFPGNKGKKYLLNCIMSVQAAQSCLGATLQA